MTNMWFTLTGRPAHSWQSFRWGKCTFSIHQKSIQVSFWGMAKELTHFYHIYTGSFVSYSKLAWTLSWSISCSLHLDNLFTHFSSSSLYKIGWLCFFLLVNWLICWFVLGLFFFFKLVLLFTHGLRKRPENPNTTWISLIGRNQ